MNSSNTQQVQGFTRTLTYRPIVSWMHRGVSLSSLSFFLAALILMASGNTQNNILWIYCGLISLILSISAGIYSFVALRPLAITKILVEPEKITQVVGNKRSIITAENLKDLAMRSSFLWGTHFIITVKDSRKKIKFSPLIERSDYVLHNLHRLKSNIISEEDFQKFRTQAVMADHTWARIHNLLTPFEKFLLYHFLVATLMSGIHFLLMYSQSRIYSEISYWVNSYVMWLGVSMVISFIGSFCSEIFYTLKATDKIKKGTFSVRRNLAQEKTLQRKIVIIQIISAALLSAVFSLAL